MGFVGCNLNPDPSGGAWNGPPLLGPLLVSAVRGAVRARRPGDDPRQRGLQRQPPHDDLALPRCRHHGVHPADDVRPVRRLPDVAVHHPPRWRSGALPLGSLPRDRPGPRTASAGRGGTRQRLVRHVRLPPGGHRPAAARRADRQHPVRLGDAGRGARRRPRDRAPLRRHPPVHRGRRAHRRTTSADLRDQRPAGLPAAATR